MFEKLENSEDVDYICECGTANSTSSKPTSCVLLIGGAEGGTTGEDGATRWFLEHLDRGNYLVLRFGRIGEQAA